MPVNALRMLLPLLLFLSAGGSNLFALGIPELRQEKHQSEEQLKSARIFLWAIRENTTPEFSDPSENHFYGSISTREYFSQREIEKVPSYTYSGYQRDIRNYLSRLTFPTHFFL